MAIYHDAQYLKQGHNSAFNTDHRPGGNVPHSGIYRCMGCGREIVAEERRQFPPHSHHQHTAAQGIIRWRMTVYADHQAK
ncbi:hypothetical protein [Mucilaginibacter sp. L3T2-6]|uniref:hypothetical protein n=1 Tax=Mucilaginibacter sp. L3T2-6 TaxID=3062491 RepID=UPI0026747DF5|nr:hypothetical protein [Mucilaginibacter sp. L3T2-6]MDO3641280.1 hypothetical protein [Mucilaginibacter sp. L3T2-6]MDV6213960.1 hypothetical protein [Mucilaginibacter sp. L3T2-6]